MSGEWLLTVGNIDQITAALAKLSPSETASRNLPRIALLGRSNVGKSSLINALLGGKHAQVSNEPGKTRCLHFYRWKEQPLVLVDLPGYGFAKTAKTERGRWAEFIEAYITQDPALLTILLLLDARHGPTDLDIEAIQYLREHGARLTFIFTKSDKLKTQKEKSSRLRDARLALKPYLVDTEERSIFWTAAHKKTGVPQLQGFLRSLGEDNKKHEESQESLPT
jgi:GTP-binding protein